MTALLCALSFLSLPAWPAPLGAPVRSWHERRSAGTEESLADVSEEVRLGREVAARLLLRYGPCDRPALARYVDLVGRSLAENSSRPELSMHFVLLDSEEAAAFAAPGGYVLVTRGALESMRDEAELAGVLAHELSHVARRHLGAELDRRGNSTERVSGLLRLLGTSPDAKHAALADRTEQSLDILLQSGLPREADAQADRDAVMLVALAGYDPSGLQRWLERRSGLKDAKASALDRTHPPARDRVGWVKDAIAQNGLAGRPLAASLSRFLEAVNGPARPGE